jgi:hypothetical protein
MPFLTIGTATTQGPGGDRNDHDQGQLRLQPEAHAAVDHPSPFPMGGATGRAQSLSPELDPCAVLLRECDPRRLLPRESSPRSQEPEGPCSAEWPIPPRGNDPFGVSELRQRGLSSRALLDTLPLDPISSRFPIDQVKGRHQYQVIPGHCEILPVADPGFIGEQTALNAMDYRVGSFIDLKYAEVCVVLRTRCARLIRNSAFARTAHDLNGQISTAVVYEQSRRSWPQPARCDFSIRLDRIQRYELPHAT